MIYLLIICVVGLGLAAILDRNYRYEGWTIFSFILGAVCGIFFVLGCIITTVDSNQFIRRYKSTQQTISASGRASLENAALTMKLIECNQELNDWKYWNGKWHTGFLISDEIETIEPLK